jgi:hypothetical protein
MIRTYSELAQFSSFLDRYRYLALRGQVGAQTFGHDRWINQEFYRSREWRRIRMHVQARDLGCDLGVEGFEIHDRPIIHHMNPIDADAIAHGDADILDPEFLITTTHRTHNAIHYGDESLLPQPLTVRRPGDTLLWSPSRRQS